MNLFTKLLTNVAGGAGVLAFDEWAAQNKPNWTLRPGASAPTPAKPAGSPGVAITPGAIAAVVGAAALAFTPGKAEGKDAPMWKMIASNFVSGALIVEGTKFAQNEVLPLVRQKMAPTIPPGAVQAPLMYGVAGRPGLPNYGQQVSDFELARTFGRYRVPQAAYPQAG